MKLAPIEKELRAWARRNDEPEIGVGLVEEAAEHLKNARGSRESSSRRDRLIAHAEMNLDEAAKLERSHGMYERATALDRIVEDLQKAKYA